MDEVQPERSSVGVTTQASGIDTNDPNRDTHLKSPHFCDVEKTPTITDTSRSITASRHQQYDVTGTGAMPAPFLAHGSPFLRDDTAWVQALAAWARALSRPTGVLMLSAHWEQKPVTLGAATPVPLVYDFYGFPARYYDVRYAALGAPALAARVRQLLSPQQPIFEEPARGIDHGAYVPLLAMYPQADVPVLQVSLPSLEPTALFELGRGLTPLRDEGVLIVGSGFLTHNLRSVVLGPNAVAPAWAVEFDAWAAEALARQDVDGMLAYRRLPPGVRIALPAHEHFAPVLAALGSAVERTGPVRFPITGFAYGSMTKRSVQFG